MPPSVLNSCWRELMLMLDLLVACIIVQLLADGWMWQVVNQYQHVSLLAILHLMPGRLLLSTILTAGMLFFVIYRMTTTQCLLADRGMFVLGCGAVAGFIADVLKFVFGRSYPDAEAHYGLSSYHPFHSDVGLGSFPSAHASHRWPSYGPIIDVFSFFLLRWSPELALSREFTTRATCCWGSQLA